MINDEKNKRIECEVSDDGRYVVKWETEDEKPHLNRSFFDDHTHVEDTKEGALGKIRKLHEENIDHQEQKKGINQNKGHGANS